MAGDDATDVLQSRASAPAPFPFARPSASSAGLHPLAEALIQRAMARAGLAVAVGLMLAWLGPFGTGRVDGFARAGYWIGILVAWASLSGLAGLAGMRFPAARASLGARALTKFAVAIAPMSAVVLFATQALLDWRPGALEVAELFLQIAVLGSGFDILARMGDPRRPAASAAERPAAAYATPEPAPEPAAAFVASPASAVATLAGGSRLVQRLPFHLRGPILCLQMEDHYVRVHTARGSALVLMRLTDAIDELDGEEGLRVHRSWWVSTRACEDVRRSARSTSITLTGGLAVPVSRRYIDAVAGLAARPPQIAQAA